MEEELNYLNELIEIKEHDIDIAKHQRYLGEDVEDTICKLDEEYTLLENILNYITGKELEIK